MQYIALPDWMLMRLTKKIGPPDSKGCRPWLGLFDAQGRGVFPCSAKAKFPSRVVSMIWIITNGLVPPKTRVQRTCKNPKCYAVEHMYLKPTKAFVDTQDADYRQTLFLANKKTSATCPQCAACGTALLIKFSTNEDLSAVKAMWLSEVHTPATLLRMAHVSAHWSTIIEDEELKAATHAVATKLRGHVSARVLREPAPV